MGAVLAALPTSPGESAFPGANGKIAFTTIRDGNDEVYVMNADGSGQTNLTNNVLVDTDPAWSPDGSKIAFTTNRDNAFEVYVMNADGSSPTNLTNNLATDFRPDWQPLSPLPPGPPAVGGVVELIADPDASPAKGGQWGDRKMPVVAFIAIGLLLLGVGGLYVVKTRRRRPR